MSLGPVVRNVLDGQHFEPNKPNLYARQVEETLRHTPDGLIKSVRGKLAFQPNYAGNNPAPKLTPYREPAYVPFQGDQAYLDPAPLAKPVVDRSVAKQSFEPAQPKLAVDTSGCPWRVGDRVRKAQGRINNGCTAVVEKIEETSAFGSGIVMVKLKWEQNPHNDDGRFYLHKKQNRDYLEVIERPNKQAQPAKHEFAQGDKVRVVATVDDMVGLAIPRKCAELIANGDVGVLCGGVASSEHVGVRFSDSAGGVWAVKTAWLVPAEAKAQQDFDPFKEPLKVGDRVKQTREGYVNQGCVGTVVSFDGYNEFSIDWDTNANGVKPLSYPWKPWQREFFEIIERPAQ